MSTPSGSPPLTPKETQPRLEPEPFRLNGKLFTMANMIEYGTHGTVYTVSSGGKDPLALKLVRSTSENYEKRIDREIAIMQELKEHPNIVRIVHSTRATLTDARYIVMEHCANGDLYNVVGQCTPEMSRLYFRQVADALRFMHWKGIVHADVKAENLLVFRRDLVKLCDFGASQYFPVGGVESVEVRRTYRGGTRVQMSPRKFVGQKTLGTKDDVWALGLTLFFMVSRGADIYKSPTMQDPWYRRWIEYKTKQEIFRNIAFSGMGILEVFENTLEVNEDRRWDISQIMDSQYCRTD